MRRTALLLLLALLLTACQVRQGATRTGTPGAATGAAITGGQTPGSAAAAAGAPGGPAPDAAPSPDAAALRVPPALRVEVAKGTKVYTGRGPWYLVVAELRAGTAVQYLDSREGWLLVRLADGSSGWLAAADALLSDARDQDVQYHIQPGRWELATPAGAAVTVTRQAAGVIAVALVGLSGARQVVDLGGSAVAAPDLGTLPPGAGLEEVAPDPKAVPAPQLNATTLALPRGMAAGGLRLHLPAPPQPYALYRLAPGQLELRLLAPGLAGKTIVVDAGHGGEESGASGSGGHLEKDINLAVALRRRPLPLDPRQRRRRRRPRHRDLLSPAQPQRRPESAPGDPGAGRDGEGPGPDRSRGEATALPRDPLHRRPVGPGRAGLSRAADTGRRTPCGPAAGAVRLAEGVRPPTEQGVERIRRSFPLELILATLLVFLVDWLWQPVLGIILLLSFAAGIGLAVRHGAAKQAAGSKLGATLVLGAGVGVLITVVSGALALVATSGRERLLRILGSLFVEPWEEGWQVGLARLYYLIGFLALVALVWAFFAWRQRARRS